jgi:hypothetical protein
VTLSADFAPSTNSATATASRVLSTAASNVPVDLAWKRVRDGRLGTRNACNLAFDCFHPQWDPRHLWLVPITQAIQLQMVRNLPYADPIPVTSALLQPTWWEGDGPPAAKPKAPAKPVASPMSTVMAAIQVPTSRFARWRNRLT